MKQFISTMKVAVNNRQNLMRIRKKRIASLVQSVVSAEGLHPDFDFEIGVSLVDDAQMRILHKQYLHKDCSTDVMAFPIDRLCEIKGEACLFGEVIVSVERATEVAKKYKNTPKKEVALYIIHGVLHLLGWRDKAAKQALKMRLRQEALLKDLYQGL
ncbi:MAG: rRNA maturation RNase YbeY [Chlamydiota bacterium]|nr:rRNA maturation RNase YbeY [Chlamydiota bacterium]